MSIITIHILAWVTGEMKQQKKTHGLSRHFHERHHISAVTTLKLPKMNVEAPVSNQNLSKRGKHGRYSYKPL